MKSYAQSKIIGKVTDNTGNAVVNASVLLKTQNGASLRYVLTGSDGEFAMSLENIIEIESSVLHINCLGFVSFTQNLKTLEKNIKIPIILQKSSIELEDVVIRSKPYKRINRDTLSYNVASFTRPEHMYIGEVIANMPGMNISKDGSISYNGQRVKNLYVHGDDFLSSQYGAIHKTLPKNMIQSVEVFLNDQPIKVLKNKDRTNDIAINLVLKDENQLKWTKDLLIGGGVPDAKHEGNLNIMLFNKKVKNMSSFKRNNIGINYDTEIMNFQEEQYLSANNFRKGSYLISSGTAGTPDLSESLTYQNTSSLLNSTTRFNHTNNWSTLIGIHLGQATNKPFYQNQTDYYSGKDTIGYNEEQTKTDKNQIAQVSVELRKNSEEAYFSNQLKLNMTRDNALSNYTTDSSIFNERLINKGFDLKNNLQYIPVLKNSNTIELNWLTILQKYDQDFHLFGDSQNQGPTGPNAFQELNLPTYFNRLSLQYRTKLGAWKQNYSVGMTNERRKVFSDLATDLVEIDIENKATNRLIWVKNTLFMNPRFQYRKSRFNLDLEFPLLINFGRYKDEIQGFKKNIGKVFFNPEFRASLDIASEDLIELRMYSRREFAPVNNLYEGFIMTNYRTIQANNSELFTSRLSGGNLRFELKRSLDLLFSNVQLSYNEVLQDNIRQIVFLNNLQTSISIPYKHKQQEVRVHAEISKFIGLLKSTSTLRVSQAYSFFNSFINQVKEPFKAQDFNVFFDASYNRSKWFELKYSTLYASNKTKTTAESTQQNFSYQKTQNNVTLKFKYKNNIHLSNSLLFSNFHSNNSNTNFSYSNANLTYLIPKKNFSIDLELFNMGNRRLYEEINSYQSIFSRTSYSLNGRRIMLTLHLQL